MSAHGAVVVGKYDAAAPGRGGWVKAVFDAETSVGAGFA